jgi:hypothetical protein
MATFEHNEQKLKLLRTKYDKLNSIAEAVRSLEQIDALIELADDIATLETKVEKQRKKASVTQGEADEAERQATAAFSSFVHSSTSTSRRRVVYGGTMNTVNGTPRSPMRSARSSVATSAAPTATSCSRRYWMSKGGS